MDNLFLKFEERYTSVPQDENYFYFYKHLSFDEKFNVLGVINNNEFKYTNPIDFNDPFDCHFTTEIDFTNFNKKNAELVFKQKIPAKKWLQVKEKIKAGIRTKMLKNFTQRFREELAVTCFNTDPLNMLMWSHYAYNHTGFLLEFRIPKSLKINDRPLPVSYNNDYPVIKLNWNVGDYVQKQKIQVELGEKMSLIKAECWSYENEFRLLHDGFERKEGQLILKKYNPEILCSVIAGAKIKQAALEKLSESIKNFNIKHNLNIQVFKAQLAEREFKIVVPQHPRLSNRKFI